MMWRISWWRRWSGCRLAPSRCVRSPAASRRVSSAPAAGAADLRLRQRHLLLVPDRAGDLSRPRRALRGGEPAPRPRHHRCLPSRQPRCLRGGLPAGVAAGPRERPASPRHGGDRRHQDRRQRLQDPLGALRPGEGPARQARRRHRRADRPRRSGRCRGSARPAGAARRDRKARGAEGQAGCRLRPAGGSRPAPRPKPRVRTTRRSRPPRRQDRPARPSAQAARGRPAADAAIQPHRSRQRADAPLRRA